MIAVLARSPAPIAFQCAVIDIEKPKPAVAIIAFGMICNVDACEVERPVFVAETLSFQRVRQRAGGFGVFDIVKQATKMTFDRGAAGFGEAACQGVERPVHNT